MRDGRVIVFSAECRRYLPPAAAPDRITEITVWKA